MKNQLLKRITAIFLMTCSLTASAILFQPFQGWDKLIQSSPDIVVAKCLSPSNNPTNSPIVYINSRPPVNIDVVSVIKGNCKRGKSELTTWREIKQGEFYLVFGYGQAFAEYRVIPIGTQFNTNDLSGKSFNAQIRMLLQRRLDILNAQKNPAQEEKERLNQGIKVLGEK